MNWIARKQEKTKTGQWEVTKYGQIIDRADIERGDIGIITTKIYKYQDKYYVELWDSGCCIHFSEVLGT